MYDPDEVDIVDPVTDEVVTHCHGPAVDGSCPGAGPNGIVLCQGCRLKALNAGPEYWNLMVPPESRQCPRTWNLDAIGY